MGFVVQFGLGMVLFHCGLRVTVFPACLNRFRVGLDQTSFDLDISSLDSLVWINFGPV